MTDPNEEKKAAYLATTTGAMLPEFLEFIKSQKRNTVRELNKSMPGACYINKGFMSPWDVDSQGKHYEDSSDRILTSEKVRTLRMLNSRSILLDGLQRATRERAWGSREHCWYSDGALSFVVDFDPEDVDMPDDVEEDFRQLADILVVLGGMFEDIPLLKHCPLQSVRDAKRAIEQGIRDAKAAADNGGEIPEEDGQEEGE